MAVGGDEVTVGIQLESRPSRVTYCELLVGSLTTKKPLPEMARSVPTPVLLTVPWLKLFWMAAVVTPVPTWPSAVVAEGLAEGVLEIDAGVFEAGGVHIGDVVANDVDVLLELLEAADGGIEGSEHRFD